MQRRRFLVLSVPRKHTGKSDPWHLGLPVEVPFFAPTHLTRPRLPCSAHCAKLRALMIIPEAATLNGRVFFVRLGACRAAPAGIRLSEHHIECCTTCGVSIGVVIARP